MSRMAWQWIAAWGCLVTLGCGTGEVVPLDLRAAEPDVVRKGEPVKVAVQVFEDARPEIERSGTPVRIGHRTHLGGGQTYYTVKGGQLGPVVAQVLADYLRLRGVDAWVVKPGDDRVADVTIGGRVQECQASVLSHVGWTDVAVRTKVDVEARNLADQATVRMTLNGEGEDTKVIFDPPDLEQLLNDAFNDSLKEFMKDTNIAQRLLRLG